MKQLSKLKLTLVLILSSIGILAAQEISVTGKVMSSEGNELLPGVSITIKGTSKGVTTDFDGIFTIEANKDDTLLFSYMGFKVKEIVVTDQKNISVFLDSDVSSLDEVVIVGYGSQRKSDLTGAVTSVGSAKIAEQPSLRIEDALQGKVGGVSIQRTSGSPDGALRVRIRGTNSLQGNNSPLYVVDGVLGADMSGISVNDIQSIEVLKDASATAIYGSQGSNGVILVATKRAKSGTTVWSFNSNIGFDSLVNDIRIPTPYEYTQIANLAVPGSFTDTEQQAYLDDPSLGTNWTDEIFRTGLKQDYQFSAQGGSDNIKYYVSTTYNDIEAIVENDNYKRFGLRSNLDFKLSDKAKLTVNVNASRIERESSDIGVNAASFYSPLSQKYDDEGNYAFAHHIGRDNLDNPLFTMNEEITDGITNQMAGLVRLDLDLVENLTYSFTGAASTSNRNSSRFFRYLPGDVPSTSTARIIDRRNLSLQATNQLNYSNTFGEDHSLNITAVQEVQSVQNTQTQIDATNFISTTLGYRNLNLAESIASTNEAQNRNFQLASFMGRVNYGYKNTYLFTASMRADGSSKFAKGNKWAYFPSAAFAWKLSNEAFLEDSDNVDLFKLRLSYGKVGSQSINPYQTFSTLIAPTTGGVPVENGTLTIPILLGDPASPDLKWETTAQYDIGVDLEMFDGLLSVVADYYYKKTSDLLYSRPTPLLAGNVNPFVTENIGEMENSGFEFMVSSDIIQKDDFNLNIGANLSVNKNKLLSIEGLGNFIPVTSEQYQPNSFAGVIPYVLRTGRPLAEIQGLIYEGPYRTEDQALATAHGRDLGSPRYRDTNGDGLITVEDAVVIGNGTPDYTLGLNVNGNYKNFDFSMFVQSVQGFDLLNLDSYQRTRGYTNIDLLNAWSPTNESSNQWAYSSSSFDNPGNTQYLEDGSFIRLKNVTLGYTIPSETTSAFGIDSFRFYINAQNVFTITDYTGYDPEASATGDRDQSQGISDGDDTYPNAKSISLGLNVKF
ncbi:SusC/RagA family TonB-linked outer membrane protein [Lutibacter citreus]|uniref:SusC/RagA family TonB-linked outer membrane protein n=1 Tax=Lutibacter citreus TaxID=2138210 RepID=UPI000DBE9709|nr:TonB-dependent receptor [Lutibacter citreus]